MVAGARFPLDDEGDGVVAAVVSVVGTGAVTIGRVVTVEGEEGALKVELFVCGGVVDAESDEEAVESFCALRESVGIKKI